MGLVKTFQVHEEKALTSNLIATLQVPTNGRITSLMLQFKTGAGANATEAHIRAEIGNIRLTLGGRDVVNAPAVKLLDLYETLGVRVGLNVGTDGIVELNVGRLFYMDPLMRDAVGFGTANITSIQIQVQAGTLSNIASVQAFSRRQAVNENLGTHLRFIQYPQSFNATGDHTVDTLPRDTNSAYLMALVDDGASGTITFGEARVNSNVIAERCPTPANKSVLSNDGLFQPAGYFAYSFTDGATDTRLPMIGVSDFRLINTFSVAPGAAGYNICTLTVVDYPNAA